MDFYEELGVSPAADDAEIRRAFRRLVRLFHPDQFQDPETKAIAGRQMIRLNQMMRMLSDPERRRRYDLFLLSGLRMPLRPRRVSVRERVSETLNTATDIVNTAWRLVCQVTSGTRRPLAASVVFACLMALIIGWLQLGGIRHIRPRPLVKAAVPPSSPRLLPRAAIRSLKSAQPARNLRLHVPHLTSAVPPVPVSGY